MLRILFVCQDNSAASQMAEAFASMRGPEGVEAYSAAPEPAAGIDPAAVDSMRELGYDMSQHFTRALDELPDIEFDYLVTLGGPIECPLTKARLQVDWDVPDPKGMGGSDFRDVRDAIRQRVDRLLAAPRIALD
ncbi:MAG: arsenate reductase ArsC [Gammaproteobacteria bacterium]|nr:arsenate reductase ArsC [Gammaproteobacteria bacterium]